jgi:hypothetical protein
MHVQSLSFVLFIVLRKVSHVVLVELYVVLGVFVVLGTVKSVYRVPFKWLFPNDDHKHNPVKEVKAPIWVGNSPVRRLKERLSIVKEVKAPIWVGISPVRRFLDRFRHVKKVKAPIWVGIVLVKWFPYRYSVDKKVKAPIVVGISPVRRL